MSSHSHLHIFPPHSSSLLTRSRGPFGLIFPGARSEADPLSGNHRPLQVCYYHTQRSSTFICTCHVYTISMYVLLSSIPGPAFQPNMATCKPYPALQLWTVFCYATHSNWTAKWCPVEQQDSKGCWPKQRVYIIPLLLLPPPSPGVGLAS
jgi:hypothetical protein